MHANSSRNVFPPAVGLCLLAMAASGVEATPETGASENVTPQIDSSTVIEPGTATVERTVYLMGTSLSMAIDGHDHERALEATERVIVAFEQAEARLSTWRHDSELATLNRGPKDRAIAVSAHLRRDLESAQHCARVSGGAFDPTIGALVDAWGLRSGGQQPSDAALHRARAASGIELTSFDEGTVTRHADALRFEEGGFGKGVGLRDAVDALRSLPGVQSASLDIGGQIAVFNTDSESQDADTASWLVQVADPRDRTRAVVSLDIHHGSVATTGNSERGIVVAGRRQSHILDPRTGRPADDFGSATVWSADPVFADCLSTALFVMGGAAAIEWAARTDGVEALVLEPVKGRLRARATDGLLGRIRLLATDIDLIPGAPTTPALAPQGRVSSGSSARDTTPPKHPAEPSLPTAPD